MALLCKGRTLQVKTNTKFCQVSAITARNFDQMIIEMNPMSQACVQLSTDMLHEKFHDDHLSKFVY